MVDEVITIELLHNPKIDEDNGFNVIVYINGAEKTLELSQDQLLHIGAILLNASNTFIQHAKHVEKNDKERSNTHCQ